MVRNYIRKSNRRSWTMENLRLAISAVKCGVSKCFAAREFGIPKKTLLRYLLKSSLPMSEPRLGSFSTVFTQEQEEQLMGHILHMSECFHGLTARDVRSLAFELAESNEIPHPFEPSERLAGYEWFKSFMKRHPDLALPSPENTSLARAIGFNQSCVNKYFDLLERIFAEQYYSAHRIWNMDETGFSTVQTKPFKIIAKKGQHQVAGISSSERGTNTTVVMAMSASGEFLPPMFIFARQRMNDALKIGAPEGSIFACNPSGWSSITTCVEWFDHFLSYTRPTVESPVLLILDGHSTHTRNFQMLEKANRNFVRIISIPPHTSHKVQPLDVAMMGPLKTHYARAIGNFHQQNPGKTITAYNISSLVNQAFVKSASVQVAQNGFRATGIHPFNRDVFTDADFTAANYLHSIKNGVSVLSKESMNLPDANAYGQANENVGKVESQNTMAFDLIDQDEYYVIRSNGDIVIGPIANLEYSYAESEEQPELANVTVTLNGCALLDSTYQENSLTIDGRNDDSLPLPDVAVKLPDVSLKLMENPENIPPQAGNIPPQYPSEEATKSEGKNKRKVTIEEPPTEQIQVTKANQIKKVRWDHNLKKSENCETKRPRNFMVSPSTVAKRRATEHKVVPRRKRTGSKKEQAVDLTSSPHRKKLIESAALKDITNIKKTARNPSRKKWQINGKLCH